MILALILASCVFCDESLSQQPASLDDDVQFSKYLSILAVLTKKECEHPTALKSRAGLCLEFQKHFIAVHRETFKELLKTFQITSAEFLERTSQKEFAVTMHENIRFSVVLMIEIVQSMPNVSFDDLFDQLFTQSFAEAYFLQLFEKDQIKKHGRMGTAFEIATRLRENRDLIQQFKQEYKTEIMALAVEQGVIKESSDESCVETAPPPRAGGRPVKAPLVADRKQERVFFKQTEQQVRELLDESSVGKAQRVRSNKDEL